MSIDYTITSIVCTIMQIVYSKNYIKVIYLVFLKLNVKCEKAVLLKLQSNYFKLLTAL